MNLRFLRPLFNRPGSWASVYLDTSRVGANADHEVELRWRALRATLAGQGADAATLAALDEAVRNRPTEPGRHGLALFARAGEVALVEPLPAPPPTDEAHVGALPHAMPLLAQRGGEVPHVRVLADRTGADLTGLTVDGTPRQRTVHGGESFPLTKVQAGGWSHRRYQQAAEVSWERNAGDVAAAAADLAESVGAEVIVVGGDVRAAQLFRERLPVRWRDRTVRTDAGSRHAGADNTALDDVTVQAIAEVADRHDREVVDRFRAQAVDGTAPTGLAEVVAGLQRGQVDTVLLVNDTSSTDTLWIGPDNPTHVAADEQTLRALGVHDPQRVRADAALLRAIAGTDAELVLVGPGEVPLAHGVGAVLRYADASTA
ncbi:peptide chain release factor 1 [Micromonospora sp. KC606]|uniref:baeRF2 domain-containing protein n=1 Tax=Micromonospora sp. KC606 TaxID=2530379 RepID=UPI001044664A|nr:Vms1/Ankzf1 family peptidyl-tRNA hydrolase [Micromonospora sp. KC606]TDC85442.1 peptide chain release factor 1 [Micromonospora sp. KC606]